MKVYKFSVFLMLITSLALLYVHQQVQLLKISYEIESNEKQFTTLLDQNKALVYNIARLKSPVYLNKRLLATNRDFAIPQQWRVIEVAAQAPGVDKGYTVKVAKAKGRGPFEIFGKLGRPKEAFANTVK